MNAATAKSGQHRPHEDYVAELLRKLHDEEARHQVCIDLQVLLMSFLDLDLARFSSSLCLHAHETSNRLMPSKHPFKGFDLRSHMRSPERKGRNDAGA